jgi:glutamine cyclotransferase
MKKQYIAVAVFVLTALFIGFLAISLFGFTHTNGSSPTPTSTQTPSLTSSPTSSSIPTTTPSTSNGPTIYTYKIVKTYPHDTNAFTEGLVFDNSVLYESTGEYGFSSLRRVNLDNGNVQQNVLLSPSYFGEGLTVVNGSLIQLTWQNNIGFIYDKETLGLKGNFSYSTEGWGLTYDGDKLIMSDGTSNLTFLDPVTFQKVGQVTVHDANAPVTNINELEYVNGEVYANIWLQQKIAIINPQTGLVKGWIDLAGIYQSDDPNAVLNGIAYESQTNRLFVTGKDWPSLYHITIVLSK